MSFKDKIGSAHAHLRGLDLTLTEFLDGYLSSDAPEIKRSTSLWTSMNDDRRYGPAIAVERIFAAVRRTDSPTISRFGQFVIPLLHSILDDELSSAKWNPGLRSIDRLTSDDNFKTDQLAQFQDTVTATLPCFNEIASLLCGRKKSSLPSTSRPSTLTLSPFKSPLIYKNRPPQDTNTAASPSKGPSTSTAPVGTPGDEGELNKNPNTIIVAVALRARNLQLNRIQSFIGILLLFQHAPASVHEMLNHLGICVSRKTATNALKSFNEKAITRARKLASDPERVKILLFDNVDLYLKTFQQSVVNPSNLLNLTMRTLLVLPPEYKQKDVSNETLLPLRRQRSLRMDQIVDEKDGQFLMRICRVQVINALEDAVERLSVSVQKQRTLHLIREVSKNLKTTLGQDCVSTSATITVPLPILDANEGSIEGVIEVLEDSAILLGILKPVAELSADKNQEGAPAGRDPKHNDPFIGTTESGPSTVGLDASGRLVVEESASISSMDLSSDEGANTFEKTGALGTNGVLLTVGDLKSHRNVESAQAARSQHESAEEQLSYIHSLAAPWHLLLNWVYTLFKVHFSTKVNGHEVSLERCRDALKRSRSLVREDEPSFTEAWSLSKDVFAGRMQTAFQQVLSRRNWRSNLQIWSPTSADNVSEFVEEVAELVFAKVEIDKAIKRKDDVGANARLFMRDCSLGFELKSAVKVGNIGRMFSVMKLMALGFAGARRTQYLDMILDEIWTRSVLAPSDLEDSIRGSIREQDRD
ncbi:hypothetical protein CF326_g6278 [Tilletia indica]|nr:hypothetical protein CF326_g6278 [Tilletia indica]